MLKWGQLMGQRTNLSRLKNTPEVRFDTTVVKKDANNYFLRNPSLPSQFHRGSAGVAQNPVNFNSPYFAMKTLGRRRECFTSAELRTQNSCFEKPY